MDGGIYRQSEMRIRSSRGGSLARRITAIIVGLFMVSKQSFLFFPEFRLSESLGDISSAHGRLSRNHSRTRWTFHLDVLARDIIGRPLRVSVGGTVIGGFAAFFATP